MQRRHFLATAGAGFGLTALQAIINAEARAAIHPSTIAIDPTNPLAVRGPHFTPRAKNVIFLFQYGGPGTQVDMFDPKPELEKLAGHPVPASFKAVSDKVGGVFNHCHDKLLAPQAKFAQQGQSGLWMSDIFPQLKNHADELCVIRSMVSESSNHGPATYQMNTGHILAGKPSFGSWLTYGLGSENQNLPGYVLLFKIGGLGGNPNWSNGFLPAAFQGTRFRYEGTPVFNLKPPEATAATQRATLDAIQLLNRTHAECVRVCSIWKVGSRRMSWHTACRLKRADVGDLASETQATLDMYGVGSPNKDLDRYARQCLLARRLIQRGARGADLSIARQQRLGRPQR